MARRRTLPSKPAPLASNRRHAVLIASLGLVLATTLAMLSRDRPQGHNPPYSVAEVEARLAMDPRAWAHRTLLLRGVALRDDCFVERAWLPCAPLRAFLTDAGPPSTVQPLPLAWGGPDSLLAVVRRMPLLGGLARAPQMIKWAEIATYRVKLQPIPGSKCGTGACIEAILPDAAP